MIGGSTKAGWGLEQALVALQAHSPQLPLGSSATNRSPPESLNQISQIPGEGGYLISFPQKTSPSSGSGEFPVKLLPSSTQGAHSSPFWTGPCHLWPTVDFLWPPSAGALFRLVPLLPWLEEISKGTGLDDISRSFPALHSYGSTLLVVSAQREEAMYTQPSLIELDLVLSWFGREVWPALPPLQDSWSGDLKGTAAQVFHKHRLLPEAACFLPISVDVIFLDAGVPNSFKGATPWNRSGH